MDEIEVRIRAIAAWLSMSRRNQDLLSDRIVRSYTHGQLGAKYRLSRKRTKQIEMQFWDRIVMRLLAFDGYCGNHEEELIHDLLNIRLHNPAKVGELLEGNERSVTMYGFSAQVSRCLEAAGISGSRNGIWPG